MGFCLCPAVNPGQHRIGLGKSSPERVGGVGRVSHPAASHVRNIESRTRRKLRLDQLYGQPLGTARRRRAE